MIVSTRRCTGACVCRGGDASGAASSRYHFLRSDAGERQGARGNGNNPNNGSSSIYENKSCWISWIFRREPYTKWNIPRNIRQSSSLRQPIPSDWDLPPFDVAVAGFTLDGTYVCPRNYIISVQWKVSPLSERLLEIDWAIVYSSDDCRRSECLPDSLDTHCARHSHRPRAQHSHPLRAQYPVSIARSRTMPVAVLKGKTSK